MDIKGKTIVITGAGRGLGQSMAVTLARQGAHLALADLAQDRLADTASECRALEVQVACYAADVSNEPNVMAMFDAMVRDFGRVDALINNAGMNADGLLVKRRDGAIQKMPLDDFVKVVAVDLIGVFLCGREAAARMIEGENEGVIINISSISQAGNIGQSNYAAAKAGVSAMTVTWAQELARYGIRVAAIAPGFSEAQMVSSMKEEIQDKFKQRVPLRRFARQEEIAHAALFVLQNDYYNGRTLEVDGGLRM